MMAQRSSKLANIGCQITFISLQFDFLSAQAPARGIAVVDIEYGCTDRMRHNR
jgi:hypothetical protein